ncbi:hypothetical protein V6N00_12930 [Tersicoccus sp. MR15.9]|uniref:hypothetical protein n=1 Tax=Tersicoccus mangrovi TaxID=3121635 RepID=UPI002FE582D5
MINRIHAGQEGAGRFTHSLHSEASVTLSAGQDFPDVTTAGPSDVALMVRDPDPLVRAEAAASVYVTDEDLALLAEPDQPEVVRMAAAGTGFAGTADRAATDPNPLVRATAATGWDLSARHQQALGKDPAVQRLLGQLAV